MRVLAGNAYELDNTAITTFACDGTAGEESVTFDLPAGFHMTSNLEIGGSTTLKLFDSSGTERLVWNSGTFVSCFLFGTGVGGIVTGLSGNPVIGGLAGTLASLGCSNYVNRTYEDGDSFMPSC